MANLISRLAGQKAEERGSLALPFDEWVSYFNFGGSTYPFLSYAASNTVGNQEKPVPADFSALVNTVFRQNAIIHALVAVRMNHFAEARFQFRQLKNGRPGNLFGTAELAILETPWPNGTTGDLLARMLQDADLAGNSYVVRQGDRLARLRPDWVTILLGSNSRREGWVPGDADTEPVAYIYKPGGPGSSADPIMYMPETVAHFAPMPDPLANYRGMSWVTAIIREIMADSAATAHKLQFFENNATVNSVIKIPTENLELFERWVTRLREGHKGVANAYKTMYLGAGADMMPVGLDFTQMDFKAVQGGGETRMAAVAGVPPILVGFSEGLSGSSLNAGNYQTARRRFADGTIRILWRQACGALANIINVPAAAELWYDDRHISFLKEDMKEAADVRMANSQTIMFLINSGFEPDAAVNAVTSDDFSTLTGNHTGLTSVQLQPPASNDTIPNSPAADDPAPSVNGNSGGSVNGRPIVPAKSGAQ